MEIPYTQLESYLAERAEKQAPPVTLIHGEELLTAQTLRKWLDATVPASQQVFNYHPMDGAVCGVADLLESLNTYPLFPGTKVVGLLDTRIFYTQKETGSILKKAQEAFLESDMKKAARFLLDYLSVEGKDLSDLDPSDPAGSLSADAEEATPGEWVEQVYRFCLDQGLAVPPCIDDGKLVQEALQKGLPPRIRLVITAQVTDKKRELYKYIQEAGLIIDCTVPKGTGRADRSVQERLLREKMRETLAPLGTQMGEKAFHQLCELVGHDLRGFVASLEKLVAYTGAGKEITEEDVGLLVSRTKKDPIYEFTSAFAEKRTEEALFLLRGLLADDLLPLQALAAMVNQIRKLLAVKHFVEARGGSPWRPGMDMAMLKRVVLPAVQEHDAWLTGVLATWNASLSDEKGPRSKAGKGPAVKTDLLIAKNPNNAYPILQAFRRSDHFTREELVRALGHLLDADQSLKSTGQDPRLILERAIVQICGVSRQQRR